MQNINLVLIVLCCFTLLMHSSDSVDSSKQEEGSSSLVRQKREAKPDPIFFWPSLDRLHTLFNLNGNITKMGTITITVGATSNKTTSDGKGDKGNDDTTRAPGNSTTENVPSDEDGGDGNGEGNGDEGDDMGGDNGEGGNGEGGDMGDEEVPPEEIIARRRRRLSNRRG